MSIATVITEGFGTFGTIPLIVTMGFSIGDPVAPTVDVPQEYHGHRREVEAGLDEIVRKQWELLEARKKQHKRGGDTPPVIRIPDAPKPPPEVIVVAMEPQAAAVMADPGYMTDQEIIDLVLMLEAID